MNTLLFNWKSEKVDNMYAVFAGTAMNGAEIVYKYHNDIILRIYIDGKLVSRLVESSLHRMKLFAEDRLMTYGVSPGIETTTLDELY